MLESKQEIESTIRVANHLLKLLQYLTVAYRRLGEIIEDEHQSIRDGDLTKLEKIVQVKVIHVEGIESSVTDLRGVANRLQDILPEGDALKSKKEVTLTEITDAFDRLLESWSGEGFSTDVLYRQWDLCQAALSEMLQAQGSVQKRLEVNRRVISKMQEHQQASHRFWQSVLAEAEQTYTGSGEAKGEANASMIRIQA